MGINRIGRGISVWHSSVWHNPVWHSSVWRSSVWHSRPRLCLRAPPGPSGWILPLTCIPGPSGRAALLLACALLQATGAQSQPAPVASRPTVEDGVARAMEWVGRPQREEHIDAFAPAADVRLRIYAQPRPLRVWIARIDLAQPGVRFCVTEPAELHGDDAKFETLSATTLDFALQHGVQLAINASAFRPFRPRMGMPIDVAGLAAAAGRKYSDAEGHNGALYIGRDGRIAMKAPPLDTENVWHVLPGFRMLLDDGRVVVTQQEARTSFGDLNPRTAVGADRDGRTLWIVVADGRQPAISLGLTLVELACLFRTLDAWDALNLDGGGSSTLVLERADGAYAVVNTPVGQKQPGTLRQVANNLGLYLPGIGLNPLTKTGQEAGPPEPPRTLRDAVIRYASSHRGGGYSLEGGGVPEDVTYDGRTVLRANPSGTYCCGVTLSTFLHAYRTLRFAGDPTTAPVRWFQDWDAEQFTALCRGWYGTEDAVHNEQIPAELRTDIRERQLASMVVWAGLGEPVRDYRLLRRGDLVQFWRKSGSGHSVVFWGRDRDEDGRERLWYWSSQKRPRHAYPLQPGGEPVKTPGFGVNWEYIGDEIDPTRIYGVSLADQPSR